MKQSYYINASVLNTKSNCLTRLHRIVVSGYHVPLNYNDVHYGTCWHLFRQELALTRGDWKAAQLKALECWFEKKNMVVRSKKEYCNDIFLMQTIAAFVDRYKLKDNPDAWNNIEGFTYIDKFGETEKIALVEQKVALPIYSCDMFDIILCGTLDGIGVIGDTMVIFDDKTTSAWRVDEYFAKYWTSPQMMLYSWMLRTLATNAPDSLIGQCLTKYPGFAIAIFGVFHSAANGVSFRRGPLIQFSDRQINEFEFALKSKIDRIAEMIANDHIGIPPDRDGFVNGSCNLFGASPCEFIQACTSQSYEDEIAVLDSNYKRKPYNPLETHEDI